MKKRDLLLAALFLLPVSSFAQDDEFEIDFNFRPPRFSDDAVEIYKQDFEGSAKWDTIRLNKDPKRPTTLYTWKSTPVDSIKQVAYYAKSDSVANFSYKNIYDGSAQFEIAGVRDTTIRMYDGVMRTDAVWPDDSALQFDSHEIVAHTSESQQGGTLGSEYGLDRWGENGEGKYFRYISSRSDGVANRAGSDGDHYVPEYRRNLFVRNIPIEDNSSYRVTVFVKPDVKATSGVKARIGLDLMRGYFHSEKPFLVNTEGKQVQQWWGGTSTEYPQFNDKTDYTNLEVGKWNKITLMSYYNNDSIGNASPYILTYYWQTDWDWKVNVDDDGKVTDEGGTPKTLRYIQQPAKYFVRMSFRSDSTIFDVDNLSITKSWIGGVEYLDNMIRVDFGYQTNLGALADKAMAENQIASVQLPGKYFKVYALWHTDLDDKTSPTYWAEVPILSAEYQGDGFMYMWTEPWEDGEARSFDGADSVLVSFQNPTEDPKLRLVYTGDRYPNGIDTVWAKTKYVFDFHNEIAALNPTIKVSPVTHLEVRSLAELAPVLQRVPTQNGSFGIKSDTRSFTFKFSKNLAFDDKGADSPITKVILRGNGVEEYWNIVPYDKDSINGWTTIERPASCTDPLEGDYVLSFQDVTHLKNANPARDRDWGENHSFNYHFGDFEPTSLASVVTFSNWRADIADYNGDNKRPIPTSVYLHDGNDPFQKGKGVENNGNKCGFYNGIDDTITVCGTKIPDNGMFYLSNRTSGQTGNLYSIVSLTPGTYNISFKFGGHSATNRPMALKFFAKPNEEIKDGNDLGFALLNGITDKTVLEEGRTPKVNQGGSYGLTKGWKDGIETVSYPFSIETAGDYIFEWVASGASNYEGFCISNYWITTGGDMAFSYVSNINDAINSATDKLNAANVAKYLGTEYSALLSVKEDATHFIAYKKDSVSAGKLLGNTPKAYDDEVIVINKAINALQLHVDTVDAYYEAYNAVNAKIEEYTGTAYADLAIMDTLIKYSGIYSTYDCSIQAPGQIAADTKFLLSLVDQASSRKALNEKLDAAIAAAIEIRDSSTIVAKFASTDEYAELADAIDDASNYFDAISASDEEIDAQILALNNAVIEVRMLAELSSVATKRIKKLDVLSQSLGVAYDAATAAQIANVSTDDDDLAGVMKGAIKDAIYNKIVNSENVDSLDLTPFIKNYHLYATIHGSVVDNTDLELPSARNNAKCLAENNEGSSIMHIKHQWGQDALNKTIWVLMYGKAFDNVYPGWTVQSFITSNHSMVTPDDATDKYSNLSKGSIVFDGKLTMDWNSKAELKATVADLPAGIYALNVGVESNAGSESKITVTVGDKVYEKALNGTDAKIDSITIADQMDIDFVLTSGSGGSQADDFSLLYLGPDPSFDYNAVITVVDDVEVSEFAGYEYYTLNWIKVEIPVKGQIYFRKSGNVVEKVIFK